jgi:hypothetical protein
MACFLHLPTYLHSPQKPNPQSTLISSPNPPPAHRRLRNLAPKPLPLTLILMPLHLRFERWINALSSQLPLCLLIVEVFPINWFACLGIDWFCCGGVAVGRDAPF